MLNFNLVKLTMIARMVLFPMLTLIHANKGVEPTLSRAVLTAQSENRQLMLFFTSKSCDRCKQIEGKLHSSQQDSDFARRFVVAVVDVDDFDGKACREIYAVDEIPAVVVVNPDGSIHVKAEGQIPDKDIGAILRNEDISHLQSRMLEKEKQRKSTDQSVSGKYALQLGFFSSQSNADNLKDRIESAGYRSVFVDVEERNNKSHYRVLVGGYESETDAKNDKDNLVASGFDVKIHKLTN